MAKRVRGCQCFPLVFDKCLSVCILYVYACDYLCILYIVSTVSQRDKELAKSRILLMVFLMVVYCSILLYYFTKILVET